MSITDNYEKIKSQIPDGVTLIAVSKTKPAEMIQKLYDAGHRDFGENKIQEMCTKAAALPKDIRWHMIGNVQTNKVKYMANFVHLVHGVDRYKLAKEINKQAAKHNRVQDVLLQIKIAQEDTKQGFDIEGLTPEIIQQINGLENLKVKGLMGMASFTSNEQQVATEFKNLVQYFEQLSPYFSHLKELSMGMSGDFPLAIENGSTMVRVGSAIFGERNYSNI